jgi:ABC-type uncharacterized transport system ATPase component
MVGKKSEADVWAAFLEMFSSQSKACVVQLCTTLNKRKKENTIAAVFFDQIKHLADEMAMAENLWIMRV